MKQARPHQTRTIDALKRSAAKHSKIVCVLPTGAGKTFVAAQMVLAAAQKGKGAQVYTNRRVLLDQISDALGETGVHHGMLAAGYHTTLGTSVHVGSIQSIHSRAIKGSKWELPEGKLTLVDEAHSNTGKMAAEIIARHAAQPGSRVIGLTATPVGLGEMYDDLVQEANYEDLIEQGYLVGVDIYAPNEPNLKGVRMRRGEYLGGDIQNVVANTIVHANILDHWIKLNPTGKPTLAFVPGVKESRWLTAQFLQHGIPAEHIDGETPPEERAQAFENHRTGRTVVLSSCGVLREGFDAPWTEHVILIQPCGGVSTFLQIVGRGMRPSPGKDRLILQDHAGAWHRHGRPDSNRHWILDDSDVRQHDERTKKREQIKDSEQEEYEGFACPECGFIRFTGSVCPVCNAKSKRSARRIIEQDGTLKYMEGAAEPPKRKKERTNHDKWNQCLFIGARKHFNIGQCKYVYRNKNGEFPSRSVTGPLNDKDLVYDAYPWLRNWMSKHGIQPRTPQEN